MSSNHCPFGSHSGSANLPGSRQSLDLAGMSVDGQLETSQACSHWVVRLTTTVSNHPQYLWEPAVSRPSLSWGYRFAMRL